jgi:hypothetical protein
MQSYKTAKIYFCFAVLLLVAKPFLGFCMFSRVHPPADENIFVKVFNKRKQEFSEDSSSHINYVLRKIAEPVESFLLSFAYFLSILFPVVFATRAAITAGFLNRIRSDISDTRHTWLLNSAFLI